jgi:hypothetical protein
MLQQQAQLRREEDSDGTAKPKHARSTCNPWLGEVLYKGDAKKLQYQTRNKACRSNYVRSCHVLLRNPRGCKSAL